MTDRGTVRNMYSFISKIKFEKLVHLVGFIIRKFVTMHGHMNVKFEKLVHLVGFIIRKFTMHGHMNGKNFFTMLCVVDI
jgi:hypothetical protein